MYTFFWESGHIFTVFEFFSIALVESYKFKVLSSLLLNQNHSLMNEILWIRNLSFFE